MKSPDQAFWKEKSLDQLTPEEWEALCDGCGQCCLLKLEDEETGELHHTRLACRLLDLGTCRCTDYANRRREVADCVALDPEAVTSLSWLPGTCAYRLRADGKDLHWWHPLVSGRAETVHEAGISVRDWAKPETGVPESRLHRYVISDPSRRRGRRR